MSGRSSSYDNPVAHPERISHTHLPERCEQAFSSFGLNFPRWVRDTKMAERAQPEVTVEVPPFVDFDGSDSEACPARRAHCLSA